MIAVGLVTLLVLAAPAAALTKGGGSPLTDCLAEFGGTPPNNPQSRPREIKCIDNDPACDDDPALGRCGFRVSVCLNVTDPELPLCTPEDLEEYFVENEQPDTNPLHDFELQALEDELNFLVLPVDETQQNVCSGEVPVGIYLPVRLRNGGATWHRARKKIRPTISGPGGVEDEDKLRMTCQPAEGPTPCDGVTSTFDQIQQHIFTPTSCARSTCHNVQQGAHDMSLSPGEAYANLVGVAPANFVAASAGKLRVDPGNPGNSFLQDKLHGDLVLGEGERMPLDLRRLPSTAIRLIEEWIAAGAPETGFVSPTGCQP